MDESYLHLFWLKATRSCECGRREAHLGGSGVYAPQKIFETKNAKWCNLGAFNGEHEEPTDLDFSGNFIDKILQFNKKNKMKYVFTK